MNEDEKTRTQESFIMISDVRELAYSLPGKRWFISAFYSP